MVKPSLCALCFELASSSQPIDGTYLATRGRIDGTLEVTTVAPGQLRFDLVLEDPKQDACGVMESEYSSIEEGVSIYESLGPEMCEMIFHFGNDEVRIDQRAESSCHFGMDVDMSGIWLKKGAFEYDDSTTALDADEHEALRGLSRDFARADNRLASAYATLRELLPRKSRKVLEAEQAAWLRERNTRAVKSGPKGSKGYIDVLIEMTRVRAGQLEAELATLTTGDDMKGMRDGP